MSKVSIIVPVYNVEQYIEKCLKSLINQTLKDIEIIVVNDGTKDNSQKIIDKYSKIDSRIKAYKKENGGLSSARNYGIKKATGDYIAFVDSDDYVELDMYEKMYNKAIDEKADIVVCDTINDYGNNKLSYMKSNFNYSDDVIKNYLISPPMACIRIYSKKIIKNIKFEENILYEDLNLIPKLVKYTHNICFITEGLYYYYQRNNSIMKQKKFSKKLIDIFYVLDNNFNELYQDYPEEIEYMYITHLLRTATLRFLDYGKNDINDYLRDIINLFKCRFPNWKNNIYYKKSSTKLKIICFLAFHKQYTLLKLIKKITNS